MLHGDDEHGIDGHVGHLLKIPRALARVDLKIERTLAVLYGCDLECDLVLEALAQHLLIGDRTREVVHKLVTLSRVVHVLGFEDDGRGFQLFVSRMNRGHRRTRQHGHQSKVTKRLGH